VAPDRGHYFLSGHWRGTGGGRPGKKGREVYGRREKRGQEARFLRWREAGEKRGGLRKIVQYFAIE